MDSKSVHQCDFFALTVETEKLGWCPKFKTQSLHADSDRFGVQFLSTFSLVVIELNLNVTGKYFTWLTAFWVDM